MPDEVLCLNDGGVTRIIGLTSRVAFNLTVQVFHIRSMTNGLDCNNNNIIKTLKMVSVYIVHIHT